MKHTTRQRIFPALAAAGLLNTVGFFLPAQEIKDPPEAESRPVGGAKGVKREWPLVKHSKSFFLLILKKTLYKFGFCVSCCE